jgi:transcriptional regulator with XRE-family HTH domain
MIAATVVDEVRRLLGEGHLSQRQIANRIGVSRGTVNAIALGRRAMVSTRKRQEINGFRPPDGLHVRCPGCGGRVQMPCLACYLRGQ